MYQIKIASYPNGENRITFSTCGRPVRSSSSPFVSPSSELAEEREACPGVENAESPSTPHLTLALNSMAVPPGSAKRSKSGRFTLDAKRKLLRAGGALDVFDVKPSHCLLLTGTLPGSTKEAMNEIPKHSGYIVNRLKMWIRERYRENQFSFYCWELQKRGALHIHYCVYVPDLHASERIAREFKPFWIRLLSDISDKSGVDLFAKSYGGSHRSNPENVQADAQQCRKSVSAYMAKYVSKEAGRGHRSRYPSRWSGVSRPLTALVRELTQEVVAVTPGYRQGRTLYDDAKQYLTGSGAVVYTYPHKVGIGETRVAYYSLNREEQSCQFHHASERLNSTQFCQLSSTQNLEIASLSRSINTMQSIVHQAYDYLGNGSTSSEVGLGHILRLLLRELSTVLQAPKSLRSLKREVTGLITSQLILPCAKFTASVPVKFQESLRVLIRSLWHLAERSEPLEVVELMLRKVSEDLTKQAILEHCSTTDIETACDDEGETVQCVLHW